MSPFTQFLGRLVELVGAENAAQLTREFAGQTLRFPITDHYGFNSAAPVLGESYAPAPVDHKGAPLLIGPHRLSAPATPLRAGRLLTLAHELGHSSLALQQHAERIEKARLAVLAEIAAQQRELAGS